MADHWQPKAVVFDLLTALINSWDIWAQSTPSLSQEEGRRWRERYLEITFGAGAYTPYESLVRKAADDAGLPSSAPEALLQNWAKLPPWPEVSHVLPALRAKGYKLAVVTNCSKHLGHLAVQRVEQYVGQDFQFDAATTAEEIGFYKPVAAAYESILKELGLQADEVLFVAGSAGDVQGATKVGMKVVWHNRIGLAKVGDATPLKEAKSLHDLLKDFL